MSDSLVEKVAKAIESEITIEPEHYSEQLRTEAAAKAAIAAVLEQAELAVYRQKIEGGKNDLIWNPACDACASAIRALAPSGEGEGKE